MEPPPSPDASVPIWKDGAFVVMAESGLMPPCVMLGKAASTCFKHLFFLHHSIILRQNKKCRRGQTILAHNNFQF